MSKKAPAPLVKPQATQPEPHHATATLEGPNDSRTVTGFLALVLFMFLLTAIIIVLVTILPRWARPVAMTPLEIHRLEQRIKPLSQVAVKPPQAAQQQSPDQGQATPGAPSP